MLISGLALSRRRVVVVLLLLAMAGVAVVAITREPGSSIEDQVIAAPGRLRATGTYELALTVTRTEPDGSSATTEARATVNEPEGTAHLQLAQVVGGGDLEIVTEGTTMYLSIPEERRIDPAVRWVKVRAGSEAEARGAGAGPVPDPLSVLDSLAGAGGRIERLPVPAGADREYRRLAFPITLARMYERLGDERIESPRALKGLGGVEFDGEAWLDDAGLPVRVVLTSDLGERGVVTARLDLLRHGAPVIVGIPPPDAVVTAPTVDAALDLVSVEPG